MKHTRMRTHVWKCPLCETCYAVDGEERTATCVWMHIFRKDKYYQALNLEAPTITNPRSRKAKE